MSGFISIFLLMASLVSCGSNKDQSAQRAEVSDMAETNTVVALENIFNADSAYAYVEKQVSFGPRVPGTIAHKETGDWLSAELKRHGASVTEQKGPVTTFDGTRLELRNIFGQFNPDSEDRILLLAHWDCRPWADQDAEPANHDVAVDGANDGASGVGVLLEVARQLEKAGVKKGVDILFVDVEDWGTDGDEDSWALGTQYFVANPPVANYAPAGAILLDMVGGKDATFYREYFSEQSAPAISDAIWSTAARLGYGDTFPNRVGSAVTDDHVQLIKGGIPAIDIIEFNPSTGFNPRWHTVEDNMDGIDRNTLSAVGHTVMEYLKNR